MMKKQNMKTDSPHPTKYTFFVLICIHTQCFNPVFLLLIFSFKFLTSVFTPGSVQIIDGMAKESIIGPSTANRSEVHKVYQRMIVKPINLRDT